MCGCWEPSRVTSAGSGAHVQRSRSFLGRGGLPGEPCLSPPPLTWGQTSSETPRRDEGKRERRLNKKGDGGYLLQSSEENCLQTVVLSVNSKMCPLTRTMQWTRQENRKLKARPAQKTQVNEEPESTPVPEHRRCATGYCLGFLMGGIRLTNTPSL